MELNRVKLKCLLSKTTSMSFEDDEAVEETLKHIEETKERLEREAAARAKAADEAAREEERKAEARRIAVAKAEEEERLRAERELAIAKIQEEKRIAALAKLEEEKRALSVPHEEKSEDSRTEEVIRELNKVIRQITIVKDGISTVYKEIRHSWGGVFYFKDEASITKADFDLESGE